MSYYRLNTAVERALVFPVLGSFLGCWAGAFPIPLDWDRPWQVSVLALHIMQSTIY